MLKKIFLYKNKFSDYLIKYLYKNKYFPQRFFKVHTSQTQLHDYNRAKQESPERTQINFPWRCAEAK